MLWKTLGEEKEKSCLFVDPMLIKNYYDSNGDDEGLFKNFGKQKFFSRRYVFFPLCLWLVFRYYKTVIFSINKLRVVKTIVNSLLSQETFGVGDIVQSKLQIKRRG